MGELRELRKRLGVARPDGALPDLLKRTTLIIEDVSGKVLFSEPVPSNYDLRDPHDAIVHGVLTVHRVAAG